MTSTGATFFNGRYHLGYLPEDKKRSDERDFSSWQHISSRDLLHWQYHTAYLDEPLEGKKGDYFNSGDIMEGMEIPTIITNMPRRGYLYLPMPRCPISHTGHHWQKTQ